MRLGLRTRMTVHLRRRLQRRRRIATFPGATRYWKQRYAKGGTSGAGSYGEAAQSKARVINDFVAANQVRDVIEFGCGDGAQLALADYPRYVGLDPAPQAVDMCADRFSDDDTKSFFLYDPLHFVNRGGHLSADLALSLDVVYHLVDDETFQAHIRHLFEAALAHVIIFSSDYDARPAAHVRHRAFTHLIEERQPEWILRDVVPGEGEKAHCCFFFYSRR